MLDILRRIVQEVSAAPDLQQALSIMVTRIKHAMGVDVCSIYLADNLHRAWILMASDGLNPAAVGKVKLAKGLGLISVVAEREEPVNLDDAPNHPRYCFIAETNEDLYHAFLGVPIIHQRIVLGVMVVRQRRKRLFDDNEVSFLITTAAQLAGTIAHAQASGTISALSGRTEFDGQILDGLPGAEGVAVGMAHVVYPPADLDAIPDRQVTDPDAEIAIFQAAVQRARDDIDLLVHQLGNHLAAEDKALFDAYIMMLSGETLIGRTIERIRAGSWASGALRETIKEHARVFDEMPDLYMRERGSDVRDLGRRILVCLQSGERHAPPYPAKTILVGEELSATMLAEVPTDRLVAVVSVRGSSLSHVAILARALGVPAVVGVADLPVSKIDKCELIVDGYRGKVHIAPNRSIRKEYERLEREEAALTAGLKELRDLPAETPDGFRISVYANTGLISDITPSRNSGAEGIGLHRTEIPFMIRDRFPAEEEQRQIYQLVLQSFAPRPVTLRTLDAGGDKGLPYFPIVEENPFLGWRGIRVTLDHPEIFLVQLRAMLRASAGLNNLQILLPMISSVKEFDDAMVLLRRTYDEVIDEDESLQFPKVGVMIEVPSTIFQIDALAKRADFFSIGTNDLTQYLLAVDRNNAHVAGLYDSLHPAVLKAIKQAVDAAHSFNKPIGVCGEMAGDPGAAILLLAMGVDSLSMSVSSLARVKWTIRNISRAQALEILQRALTAEEAHTVRSYLNEMLENAGLDALVRERN